MKECKLKVCPKDSHKKILKVADFVLNKNGGEGVIINILENIFKINSIVFFK